MKTKLFRVLAVFVLFLSTNIGLAQAPDLGTASDFVIFTSIGAVTNTGISQVTGNVGTNSGAITGFGNVNGQMHSGNGTTLQCAADLLIAYNSLDTMTPDFFPSVLLGNGDTLIAGVYYVSAASTLNSNLYLDAEGDTGAVFVMQIEGTLGTGSNSNVILLNGAQACNVFWKVEGAISMAAGTRMKGTVIANNSAINMNANDTLEGRIFSTSGGITINGIMAYTPVGCGSPLLTGPAAPDMGTSACYVVFSGNGPVTNSGITNLTGDVGTNVGLTTGFDTLLVNGTVHPIPDGSTSAAAADLLVAYTYLNGLAFDIELLFPAQFGNNLVLTPHTYLLNAATTFTDSLYLNAMGDSNAVFVIQINGALSTSTYAKVILINGAKAENVYWQIDGAVDINDYSEFAGTIVANNGAIDLNIGVVIDGRALTTNGAVNTAAITAVMPEGCSTFSLPSVITQPMSDSACLGDSIQFVVSATGTGLTYQWRRGNVNLVDTGNVTGSNTDTLTIYPVTMADTSNNYNVIITGTYTPGDTSVNVSLVIDTAPLITIAPTNQLACAGDSVNFTVEAIGTALTYQWRKGTVNISNGGSVSGATTAMLTIDPVAVSDVASDYNVVISGSCTPAITSSNASLTLNASPAITTAPVNQTACIGGTASFTVTATGTALTYQWRKGTVNISNGASISGATTATLTINPVALTDVASDYNVVVSGDCSPAAISGNASLTLDAAPAITTQPGNQVVCDGSSVSFTVAASGTALTYQWRKGTVNISNGGTVSGATSATLTINPVGVSDVASNYNVVVSGTCSPAVTSNNASLTLNTAPGITTAPTSQTACEGSSVSFSVVADGTALTYQWRKGTVNLSNGASISGATSSTLTINPVAITDAASNYNVIVSGTCSPDTISGDVALVLNTAPEITTAPVNQNACAGTSVNFTVLASGTALTYQWRKGTVDLVNGGAISGATSSTLNINPVATTDAASDYNVVISGTCAPDAISADVALTVDSTAVIVTDPTDIVSCEGNEVNFTVSATGTALTYQWRKGTVNISNGGTISGATTANLNINTIVPADGSANYNVVVSGAGTCPGSVTSANATLVVQIAPVITLEPVSQTACEGSSVSYTVAGYGTGISFQWKIGETHLVNGGNISGAQSTTLVINPVSLSDTAIDYNVVINGTCTPNNSELVSLTVKTAPEITLAPTDQANYTGNAVQFEVEATGEGLSYQWRRGTVNLVDGGNIFGANTSILTINPLEMSDSDSNYNVVINGDCTPGTISRDVSLKAVYPLGVEEVAVSENAISIFPNPFSTSLEMFINPSSVLTQCDLIIFDAIGNTVMRFTVQKQSINIDASHLAAGIYFYQVLDRGNTIQSGKLISQ